MSVVTRKKTVQEDRDTVMRMMRAHVEGIHFLKTQKEASQKILAKYLKNNYRELLEGSYEIYKDDFIATPYPMTRAWKRLMSTFPNAGWKLTILNRKNSPNPVLSPSSTRADLSKSYTGKSSPAATGDCAIRRSEIMVKASVTKILFVTVIASLIGLPLFAQAQDKPLKKIRWGVISFSASNWIPWLAKEAKIYEKNGLDVELILLRGSGQTSVAILGGSIFAAPVTLPTVMLADLGGEDLINVAHTVPGVQSKRWSSRRSNDPKT